MESSKDLQEIVKTAGSYRDTYFRSEYITLALMDVSGNFGIDANSELLDAIKGFLKKRKTSHEADLEKLVAEDSSKVMILGSAFYFGRRGFLMSHDAFGVGADALINPMPLVQSTFDSLEPLDNQNAADFLERFGDFLKKVPDTRQTGVELMRKVISGLKDYYSAKLSDIASSNNEGSQMYKRKKGELDAEYAEMFLKIVEYAKMVHRTSGQISFEGFSNYVGKKLTYKNNSKKELTREDINEFLAKHEPYREVIEQIEKKVPLIAGDFKGNRRTNRAGGDILYGDQASPKRLHFDIIKGSDRRLSELLGEICRYTRQKEGIQPQYATMSKISEQHINSILLR